MKLLTKAEEFVLMAIWQLQHKAYSLLIREKIRDIAGEEWSLGTIYAPLERLEKRGYVQSHLSETTPRKGGRQKRIYTLTDDGKQALLHMRKVQEAFWENLPDVSLEVE